MSPYVIRQGDYLASLAYQFGFDADTIWNDPMNAPLRQLRPNPNTLYPTDVLYIPDPNVPPATKTLATGTTNAFVADVPTATLTLQMSDPSFASQAYSVQELPELTGLTTDANAIATLSVPVTLTTATFVFASGTTFACQIGSLDPINTLSGVFQRLQSLAYIDSGVAFDPAALDVVRGAPASPQGGAIERRLIDPRAGARLVGPRDRRRRTCGRRHPRRRHVEHVAQGLRLLNVHSGARTEESQLQSRTRNSASPL